MNHISIFENNHITLNYFKYDIYLFNYKHKTQLNTLVIKLQEYNLCLYLYPCNDSHLDFEKILNLDSNDDNEIKCITYKSHFNVNKDILYLHFYFIYMIKKFYFYKFITYNYDYNYNHCTEPYKKFNTMILYKIVALII